MTVLPRSRPANALIIDVCPTTVLAFLTVMCLLLVQWIGAIAAAGFLASGCLLVVRRPQLVLVELRRYWMVFAVAGWCLLSVLWSQYPGVSLRYGIQLAVTFAIAVAIANRLSPATVLRVLFSAHLLAALLSLVFGRVREDGLGWLGIFGSKNAFSLPMSTLMLCAFAIMLDRGQPRSWRVAGLAGFALGSFMLIQAQSAGQMLATGAALAFALPFFMGRWLTLMQRFLLAGVTLALGIIAGMLVIALQDQIMTLILETTGKDATLTGRTEIWKIAFQEIARHPLTGIGFQAYWVPGNPGAEAIWEEFGISNKRGFHFHNTFISNAVEIGLIGVAIQAAAIFGAMGLVVAWAFREPRAETVFLTALMMRSIVLSMSEVVGYTQFDLATVLLVAALVFGIRSLRERRKPAVWRPAPATAPAASPAEPA
ncbi:O-antigen ligase family protein [Cereibacter sphaeroides]|uniref:O-antigen ligase family protein n=1 Tax=Cereibacter sphaeroides TaxID=1063 RepID=UPI001F3F0F11|nr:O-antigen ligase family protein [Cereibacter sphaeroides]MCE6960336.1 O-antigen ligase family protein [Cereibacter sphaeroides]MCE6975344.1 O-antigen ligase family protein [Cereibacter sphaeroides]